MTSASGQTSAPIKTVIVPVPTSLVQSKAAAYYDRAVLCSMNSVCPVPLFQQEGIDLQYFSASEN